MIGPGGATAPRSGSATRLVTFVAAGTTPLAPGPPSRCTNEVALRPCPIRIVDEARMAGRRDAMEAGVEIAFGAGPGILIVAQVVGGISQKLDHRHAEIGGQSLLPARIALGDQIHHQAAEALIILGEIVERRFLA